MGDAFRGERIGILEAELDMVEAGFGKGGQPGPVERQARGDEVTVEPGGASVADQLLQIAPDGGLPPEK